jgi:hypothetical protein
MVYIILKNLFQILKCIRYLIWLIIQISVWNGFYALAQLQCLSPSISKYSFIKISIYYKLMSMLWKNPIFEMKIVKLFT